MKQKFNREPSKCHCGKVALYRVHKSGFCREHYDDAVKAKAEDLKQQKIFMVSRELKRK